MFIFSPSDIAVLHLGTAESSQHVSNDNISVSTPGQLIPIPLGRHRSNENNGDNNEHGNGADDEQLGEYADGALDKQIGEEHADEAEAEDEQLDDYDDALPADDHDVPDDPPLPPLPGAEDIYKCCRCDLDINTAILTRCTSCGHERCESCRQAE